MRVVNEFIDVLSGERSIGRVVCVAEGDVGGAWMLRFLNLEIMCASYVGAELVVGSGRRAIEVVGGKCVVLWPVAVVSCFVDRRCMASPVLLVLRWGSEVYRGCVVVGIGLVFSVVAFPQELIGEVVDVRGGAVEARVEVVGCECGLRGTSGDVDGREYGDEGDGCDDGGGDEAGE